MLDSFFLSAEVGKGRAIFPDLKTLGPALLTTVSRGEWVVVITLQHIISWKRHVQGQFSYPQVFRAGSYHTLTWALSTVLPRLGTGIALQNAAACKDWDQLSCSPNARVTLLTSADVE